MGILVTFYQKSPDIEKLSTFYKVPCRLFPPQAYISSFSLYIACQNRGTSISALRTRYPVEKVK